jgi:hypothetical protein
MLGVFVRDVRVLFLKGELLAQFKRLIFRRLVCQTWVLNQPVAFFRDFVFFKTVILLWLHFEWLTFGKDGWKTSSVLLLSRKGALVSFLVRGIESQHLLLHLQFLELLIVFTMLSSIVVNWLVKLDVFS